jgi:ammonia channel protein AmtB
VGAVRAKNSVNIIFNNLAEACLGALIYYLVGCAACCEGHGMPLVRQTVLPAHGFENLACTV